MHSLSGKIETQLTQILESAANGTYNVDELVQAVLSITASNLEFSVVDDDRERRTGAAEVVYAEGKTFVQLRELASHFYECDQPVFMTRVRKSDALALLDAFPTATYEATSRLLWLGRSYPFPQTIDGEICVVCAGTSDLQVAEEAAYTAEWYGLSVCRIWDVGVSGIHRLLARLDDLNRARVVIVVAGMEGALASVVTGLVRAPVIAVPTSVGYGTNFGGLTTLMAMLTSCSSGLTVVNIDNGFGAATAAARMARGGL